MKNKPVRRKIPLQIFECAEWTLPIQPESTNPQHPSIPVQGIAAVTPTAFVSGSALHAMPRGGGR